LCVFRWNNTEFDRYCISLNNVIIVIRRIRKMSIRITVIITTMTSYILRGIDRYSVSWRCTFLFKNNHQSRFKYFYFTTFLQKKTLPFIIRSSWFSSIGSCDLRKKNHTNVHNIRLINRFRCLWTEKHSLRTCFPRYSRLFRTTNGPRVIIIV